MPKVVTLSSDDDDSDVIQKSSGKEKSRKSSREESSESDKDSNPDQGNGQWEIDYIRGHQKIKGEIYYHVQWKLKPGQPEDWSDSENWVKESNMEAELLTRQYWILENDKNNKRVRRDSTASSNGGRKSGSPKRKPRAPGLEDFVVSDDEIDPPPKRNRHKKKRRARTPSPDPDSDTPKETSSKKPHLIHVHDVESDSSESKSSMSDFVVSDTEEGVMIPVRKSRKNRTPSPVVVSHKKKHTWQENLHLMKDDYFLDKNDERPVILTDDEERGQAILMEAEMDEAQKEKEREKRRSAKKRERSQCKEPSTRRRARISSSSSSESEDEIPRPPRRRDPSTHVIHADREKLQAQIRKRQAKDDASNWKKDRHVVDYRAHSIQGSSSFIEHLKHQLKDRKKNPGAWRAKVPISNEMDKQSSKMNKLSLSKEAVTHNCSKDYIDSILTESTTNATAPVHQRDSSTSNSGDISNKSLQMVKTKKTHCGQFNGAKGDMALSAGSIDTHDMVYEQMKELSPKKVVRQPMEPVYVTDSEPRAKKSKKEQAVVEKPVEELPPTDYFVQDYNINADADGEDLNQNQLDTDVNGDEDDQLEMGDGLRIVEPVEDVIQLGDSDVEMPDEEREEGYTMDEEVDHTRSNAVERVVESVDDVIHLGDSDNEMPDEEREEAYSSGEEVEDSGSNAAEMSERPIIRELPEDFESLPPEHPLYDIYEVFAEECWENKYDAQKNGLKPVHVLQFFSTPPDEGEVKDFSMTVFENKPGELPLHVCQCVPTEYMLSVAPELILSCEDRLAQPAVRATMELIADQWKVDYDRRKKEERRRQRAAEKNQ